MTVKEKLLNDYKVAIVEKDLVKKETIQICRAAVLQIEKDKRVVLDDSDVIEILFKEYKKRSEAITEMGNRTDVIDKYKLEMAVIEAYLPKQMSEEEVLEIVKETIAQTGAVSARDMGKVMQAIQPRLKGKADGKLINNLVRNQLMS